MAKAAIVLLTAAALRLQNPCLRTQLLGGWELQFMWAMVLRITNLSCAECVARVRGHHRARPMPPVRAHALRNCRTGAHNVRMVCVCVRERVCVCVCVRASAMVVSHNAP